MNLVLKNWTQNDIQNLISYLDSIKDLKFKEFNDKIINTKSNTIGVQIPKLRVIAKEIAKGNFISFLNNEIPNYFELDIIYALLICKIKDNNLAYKYFKQFIITINNWAVCDIFCGEFKIVKENKNFYLSKIIYLIKDKNEFVVRTALILLLKFYISTNLNDIFNLIDTITVNYYYVEMGISWLLSFCYFENKTETLNYIKNSKLNKFVKNKTYQKITESLKITKEEKEFIRSLKIK